MSDGNDSDSQWKMVRGVFLIHQDIQTEISGEIKFWWWPTPRWMTRYISWATGQESNGAIRELPTDLKEDGRSGVAATGGDAQKASHH